MSNYGLFEADDAKEREPRAQARTAARKLDTAINVVRKDFGRFLIAATGIDEFEDRWHYSKHDIRKTVEAHVFPNTGTMRRIQNALKADWKLAHPYKLAGGERNLSPEEAHAMFDEGHDPYGPSRIYAEMPDGQLTAIKSHQHVDRSADRGDRIYLKENAGEGRIRPASLRHAEDRDAPIQDLQETFSPSSGNLIPEGNFQAYEDSVDQGGPEKVQRDFTPGGDSGGSKQRRQATEWKKVNNDGYPAGADGGNMTKAERDQYNADEDEKHGLNHEAAALVADIYTDFAQSAGLRVASLDTLDAYASTGIHEADYRLLQSMIIATAADDCDAECDDDEDSDDDSDSEAPKAPSKAPSSSESDEDNEDDDEDDAPDFGGESDSESESDDAPDFGGDTDDDGDHDDADHHADGGGQSYTVPEQAPDLDPQMLNEIPHDDTDGSAPIPPEVVDSLLGLPPGTIEQLLLQEVEQGQGGGGDQFGGAPQGGGDDFLGEGGGDNTQPPRMARQFWAAPDEDEAELTERQRKQQKDALDTQHESWTKSKSARTFWADSRRTALEEGETPTGGALEGPMEMYRGAPERWWAESEDDLDMPMVDKITQQYHDDPFRKHGPELDPAAGHAGFGELNRRYGPDGWDYDAINRMTDARQEYERGRTSRRRSARAFWAAEGDQEQSDAGGGQQAAPAQDPAAMAQAGGGMMPPPGSGAVAPPAAPAPLENQPAEDQLLDMASQAVTQMIDRETQEYQQIIDPLTQALQAIQFAQQVEQSEHPLDVTPPEGSVNVDPSQAPAAQAMQQQASRRRANGDDPYAQSYGTIDRGGPSIDDPTSGPSYHSVHPDINKALRQRFEGGGDGAWHPDKPGTILHNLGNFWDGPREVTHLGGGELEYTNPWNRDKDRFNAKGYYTREGEHRPWNYGEPGGPGYVDPKDWPIADPNYDGPSGVGGVEDSGPHYASRRQAKKNDVLRKAAYIIARRYGLSKQGHRTLLAATFGRRDYEHLIEALKLVPVQDREDPAAHISHLLAAGNPRLNRDAFMRTVMSSKPRDRAWDAWASGRDRGDAEHGRHDMDDREYDSYSGEGDVEGRGGPVGYSSGPDTPGGRRVEHSPAHQSHPDQGWRPTYDDVAGDPRFASRGRLPFDRPRLAGETWKHMPVSDAFEFENDQPKSSDNMTINDLPKMKGAGRHHGESASGVAGRFQRWQNQQSEKGLNYGQSDAALENFITEKKLSPGGSDKLHEQLGLQHPPTNPGMKTPKIVVPKAKNPVTKRGTWGEWEPTKEASFFTRRVPGWKWDDHLSGYISKEGKAFQCSCGQKIAAPSYKSCDCGKIWNVYAIGDSHHLASDSADMYIAREIPVRDNVIMANKKMAGEFSDHDYGADTPHNSALRDYHNYIDQENDGWHSQELMDHYIDTNNIGPEARQALDQHRQDYLKSKFTREDKVNLMSTPHQGWNPDEKQDPFDPRLIGAAKQSHQELLAQIDKLGGNKHPEPVCSECGEPVEETDFGWNHTERYDSNEDDGHYIEPDWSGSAYGDSEISQDEARKEIDYHNSPAGKRQKAIDLLAEGMYPGFDPDDDPLDPRRITSQYLAMIDKMSDWTKYDSPDPINEMGKKKPASTNVEKPPKDWATRLPKGDPSKKGGTWTSPTIPRKKK